MDSEERKILDVLLIMSKDTNERVTKFTRYLLMLIALTIISMGLLVGVVTVSNNNTLRECTRLYFQTDYTYPGTEITQSQTIGDVR